MVACYTPLMITLDIAAYTFINSPEKIHIKNTELIYCSQFYYAK